MTTILDEHESQIPGLAARAIRAAHKRSLNMGLPILVVKDGGLYRIQKGKSPVLLRRLPRMRSVELGQRFKIR